MTSEQDRRLAIAVNTLFLLAEALSAVFVDLFLFQVGEAFRTVGWYHLYLYVGILLSVVLAGYWAERHDRTAVLRVGLVCKAAFFVLLFSLGTAAARLLPALGLVAGAGLGFYWLGAHTLGFDVTSDADRDRFFAQFTAWSSAVATAAPFASGALIARLPGFSGYHAVFGLSLGLLAAAFWLSTRLAGRRSDGRFQAALALGGGGSPAWRSILRIQGFVGFRDGVFAFLVGLVLFGATGSELVVGAFTLAKGLITLAVSWAVGARVRQGNRWRPLWVGFFLTCASGPAFALSFSVAGVLLYTLIEAAFSPMYDIPYEALTHKVIEQDPRADARRVEYMVAREVPLNVGRLLGVATFLLAVPYLEALRPAANWYVGAVGLVPLLGWRAHKRLLQTVR